MMKKQPFLYYELKPFLLLLGALYIIFSRHGHFYEVPLALFSIGIAAALIYRRLHYRGYLG